VAIVGSAVIVALWGYYAIEPTIGSALIAAVASVANTWLLLRHEKHVDRRFDERRNVFVKGTADDPEAVLLTAEDRRAMEDRRDKPEKRKERDRRGGERRK
jgi:hypothetical protein